MMQRETSRRAILLRLTGVSFGALAVTAGAAAAQSSKVSKADVKYQFTPSGANRCGLCVSFIPPPEGGGGPGTCKAVDGPIPQNGWCILFGHR